MEPHAPRRSDRVVIELPIVVTGADCMGDMFLEQSNTTVVGRHGAKIALTRKLGPDQEVNVRCHATGRESAARVVGQIGTSPEGTFYYGVALLDPDIDLWGIEFPPAEEGEGAVGRVLLECVRCHTRELVYLHEFEAEVLETNRYLSRHCRKCVDTSVWRETTLSAGEELPGEAKAVLEPFAPPPKRTKNDRKHVRLDLKVNVCIRDPQYGEEVVVTENVSRGGFRFRSKKHYAEGWLFEVALPYTPGGPNIFAAARIMYTEELGMSGESVYGVAYVPAGQTWSGR
jgi:hypothetical protein